MFQAYLSSLGSFLMGMNAFVICRLWHNANELTHVVAELLQTLGMPLSRHVKIKICLSAIAAVALLIDAALTPLRKNMYLPNPKNNDVVLVYKDQLQEP